MMRVLIRPKADDDLEEIYAWIARDDPAAAERHIRRLVAAALGLRHYPERGTARPEIGEGARSLVVVRYLILYRICENFVEIVRFIHGARDLRDALAD